MYDMSFYKWFLVIIHSWKGSIIMFYCILVPIKNVESYYNAVMNLRLGDFCSEQREGWVPLLFV